MADTGDATRDDIGDITGDGSVWLTYAEAAERLGVDPASVKRRAIRQRWPKRIGNARRSLVAIPVTALEGRRGAEAHDTGDAARDITGDIKALVELLKGELQATKDALASRDAALAASAQELAETRERLARREGELDGVKLSAEHLQAAAAEARREMAEAENRALEATRRAEAADQAAEGAREVVARLRGRGFWRRVLNSRG